MTMDKFERPPKKDQDAKNQTPRFEGALARLLEKTILQGADQTEVTRVLYSQSEALAKEPPRQEKHSLSFVGEGGEPVLKEIPFSTQEFEAIADAAKAHRELLKEGGKSSGPARSYVLGTSFPERPENFLDRDQVVWNVVSAAHI